MTYDPLTVVVWFLGILAVLGIVGILIEPLLKNKDKEQPEKEA